MIVVDTNVIVHLWTDTSETAAAEELLEADAEWCVPILWRSEMRNALALLVRHRSMPIDTAKEIVRGSEELLREREFVVDSAKVLDLTAQSTCSAYDCKFIALAHDLGVPLITTDRQVLRDFPSIARRLGETA